MQRKVTETWWTNGGISNHHLKLAKRHKYTNSNAVSTYASVACFELQTWTNNHRTLTKPSSGAWSRRRNQVAGKPKKDAARQCIAASCSRPYWRLEIFFRVNFGDTVHKLIYIQYGHALWIILQRRPTDVQRRRLSNLFQMGMCFQLKPNVHK